MRKRIALVDADGILYAACLRGETVCDGQQLQLLTLDAVFKRAVEEIEDAISAVKADDAFVCLSDRRCFRADILPTYKGQRKATPRPLLLDDLRARFVDDSPYKVLLIRGLEADDVCGISAGRLQQAGSESVIISPDKDMLQIPGLLWTGRKAGIFEVTEESGDRFHMKQTLTGDTVDNYKGCPQWGEKRAGELLDQFAVAELSPAECWEEIVKRYEEAGLTREDCLVQARVSRILRFSDWDPEAKEPILFEFPVSGGEEVRLAA